MVVQGFSETTWLQCQARGPGQSGSFENVICSFPLLEHSGRWVVLSSVGSTAGCSTGWPWAPGGWWVLLPGGLARRPRREGLGQSLEGGVGFIWLGGGMRKDWAGRENKGTEAGKGRGECEWPASLPSGGLREQKSRRPAEEPPCSRLPA
jgi:hypothetical protein